jgi:FkbM family methyltransferase
VRADCTFLLTYWRSAAANVTADSIFVDAGSNIGSCTLLLVANGAPTVAFEPQPSNLFYLTSNVLALEPEARARVRVHPVGLGAVRAKHTMFAQKGNAGNSVIDKVVPDHFTQAADMTANSFDILVDTLDNALWSKAARARGEPPPRIPLLKMDVQGYEGRLLAGAKHLLAARAIGAIKTELAGAWLRAQGVTPRMLCATLEAAGFRLANSAGAAVSLDDCERTGDGITDLFAMLRE